MSFYRLLETFTRRGKRLKLVENGLKRNHLTYSPGFSWRKWSTFYLQIASLRNIIIFQFVFSSISHGRKWESLTGMHNKLLKHRKDFFFPLLQPDSEFLWGLLDLASHTLFPWMLCYAPCEFRSCIYFRCKKRLPEKRFVYKKGKADSFSLWQRDDSSCTVTWKAEGCSQSRDAAAGFHFLHCLLISFIETKLSQGWHWYEFCRTLAAGGDAKPLGAVLSQPQHLQSAGPVSSSQNLRAAASASLACYPSASTRPGSELLPAGIEPCLKLRSCWAQAQSSCSLLSWDCGCQRITNPGSSAGAPCNLLGGTCPIQGQSWAPNPPCFQGIQPLGVSREKSRNKPCVWTSALCSVQQEYLKAAYKSLLWKTRFTSLVDFKRFHKRQ